MDVKKKIDVFTTMIDVCSKCGFISSGKGSDLRKTCPECDGIMKKVRVLK